jgi:hypothetical protein
MRRHWGAWMLLLGACSSETGNEPDAVDAGANLRDAGSDARADAKPDAKAPARVDGVTLRANVKAITRASDALPGVFIPPYVSCAPPRDGEPAGKGPDGKVCTNVAISGSTEPGRHFPDYGSCDIVITQRPFWSVPPAAESKPDDPRLDDPAYLKELGWVSSQIEASGCVCCHDSKVLGKQAGEWDIRLGPLWLDSLSDTGLALFAGLADSSVLGAYHAKDNNGFERDVTGIPSDDSARMQKFMLQELARRGISEDQARAVPPFGGPIYANRVAVPTACGAGEGVTPDGTIVWNGADARYLYVMREESDNPGVPPNLDLPEGTLFRLDVLASQPALASGVPYGTTPPGSFQFFPEAERAPKLVAGTRYHLYVLEDVGLPLANCLFRFGDELPVASGDAGVPDSAVPSPDAGGCTLPAAGFGATCKSDGDCPCAADYCALMPGQKTGYCTKTGCKEDATVCPNNWSCFDLSLFAASLPSICTK